MVGSLFAAVYSSLRRLIVRRSSSYPDFLRYQQALDAYNNYLLAVRSELDKKERERQEQLRTELGWWKKLDGRGFERELAQRLRETGYQVLWTGRAGDQGVDLMLVRGTRRIIVQCKAHKGYISPGVVRDLYGTLIHHHADEAWLVSTGGFFKGSRAFAKGKPIRLLTIKDILEGAETTDADAAVVIDAR